MCLFRKVEFRAAPGLALHLLSSVPPDESFSCADASTARSARKEFMEAMKVVHR